VDEWLDLLPTHRRDDLWKWLPESKPSDQLLIKPEGNDLLWRNLMGPLVCRQRVDHLLLL